MSENKQREIGYYWAKMAQYWHIFYFAGEHWYVSEVNEKFNDSDFEEINETKLQPPA